MCSHGARRVCTVYDPSWGPRPNTGSGLGPGQVVFCGSLHGTVLTSICSICAKSKISNATTIPIVLTKLASLSKLLKSESSSAVAFTSIMLDDKGVFPLIAKLCNYKIIPRCILSVNYVKLISNMTINLLFTSISLSHENSRYPRKSSSYDYILQIYTISPQTSIGVR